ncbi:hypothetical protein BCR42DRAFT_424906 [Absidia repens]|uniref:Uncharacterized protein n=1 Tax=Absidia repens TaxID=90262 RepID=A0A1X2I3B3_9FUNG|nr:hypothetical protein BCR42DRAFT_424906 [Absidia repens]
MTVRSVIIDYSYESVKYELDQTRKQLKQKEIENQELRKKIFEWKRMALENESLFQTTRQQFEIQEQNLIAQHKSEMDALTTAHVEKMNEVSKTIISLQRSQHEDYDQSSKHIHNLIEDKHKETASKVIYHRQKATNLILNMNDLMTEIETKIHGYIQNDVNTSNINENEQTDSVMTNNNGADDIYYDGHTTVLPESMEKLQPLDRLQSDPDAHSNNYHLHHEQDQQHFQEYTTPAFSSSSSSSFSGSYNSLSISPRSSLSIGSISPQNQRQQPPRLKTKPTMEHLTKVIPNFLLKNTPNKQEQWKMTHRRSFINNVQ